MRKTTSLLDQLSQTARAEAQEDVNRLDQRWDRLAAGTLTEAENDELLGLADASGEAHEAYQAFKPLGPDFRRNVAAAILAQQEKEKEDSQPRSGAEDAPIRANLFEIPAGAAPPSVAPPAPRRRSLLFGAFASAASLVVGAFLVLMVDPMSGFIREPLKAGAILRGNDPVGEDFGRTPSFHNTNVVELIFKASVPPGKNTAARLYTFGADAKLQLTSLRPAIDSDGSKVMFDPILGKDLILSPGRWELVVVISRPGKFPDDAALLEAVKSNGNAEKYWQVIVTPIEVVKDE